MTLAEIAAIRARLEKATTGPWATGEYSETDYDYQGGVPVETVAKYKLPGSHPSNDPEALTVAMTWDLDSDRATQEANAAFIAHAPGDVAALLAEVERLTRERDAALGTAADEKRRADGAEAEWRETVIHAREARDKADARAEKAEAEAKRLRDFVQRVHAELDAGSPLPVWIVNAAAALKEDR